MKSNMSVSVEILPGVSFEQAVEEAIIKCGQWGVAYVQFNFNGISVSVNSRSNLENCFDQFKECVEHNENSLIVR